MFKNIDYNDDWKRKKWATDDVYKMAPFVSFHEYNT